ncbi:MAG: hypothetical protein IJB69_10585 [Clostridia bacterium]|nr:hypothetical protein [Clostridia bacterium]
MRVKYKLESCVSLTNGKIYDVLFIEKGCYRIVDDTGEDYIFMPEDFEIVEGTKFEFGDRVKVLRNGVVGEIIDVTVIDGVAKYIVESETEGEREDSDFMNARWPLYNCTDIDIVKV